MSGSLSSGLFSAGASPLQLGLAALFGSGADGNVVILSGTTTITRDMQYGNLTISGSGALVTNGYRVFVSGVLDLSQAGAGAIAAAKAASSTTLARPWAALTSYPIGAGNSLYVAGTGLRLGDAVATQNFACF